MMIRRATMEDLDCVVKFNAALATETEAKQLDPQVLREGVSKALSDPNRSLYFLAESGGKPIGQTMVTFEWSDWRNGFFWWIQSVYVDPAHRRRGVFRAVHDHVRREARGHPDVCGLRLYVHRENDRAMNTYAQLGMPQCSYLMCEEDWTGSTCERR